VAWVITATTVTFPHSAATVGLVVEVGRRHMAGIRVAPPLKPAKGVLLDTAIPVVRGSVIPALVVMVQAAVQVERVPMRHRVAPCRVAQA